MSDKESLQFIEDISQNFNKNSLEFMWNDFTNYVEYNLDMNGNQEILPFNSLKIFLMTVYTAKKIWNKTLKEIK